jgi:hypothetical protein
MLGQLFVGDAAPLEDLQHLVVAVVQQPGADAGLTLRRDEVKHPIARRYVDQKYRNCGSVTKSPTHPYATPSSVRQGRKWR